MSSTTQRIAIIGTGCIGTSIGLALRQSADADHLEIVGHDRNPGVARQAKKLGAFDRVDFNLDIALNGAKLVILAVPDSLPEAGQFVLLLDQHLSTLAVPVMAADESPTGQTADPFDTVQIVEQPRATQVQTAKASRSGVDIDGKTGPQPLESSLQRVEIVV